MTNEVVENKPNSESDPGSLPLADFLVLPMQEEKYLLNANTNNDSLENSSPRYYKVEIDNISDYLKYTRSKNPSIPASEWQNAIKIRQRCDNAIFRTNILLANMKDEEKTNFEKRRRTYINEIFQYAKNGLESGDLEGALYDLDTFEKQFVDFEGPPTRQKFLSNTLSFATILGIAGSILGLSISSLAELIKFLTTKISTSLGFNWIMTFPETAIKSFMFIIVGNSLGIALTAFSRNLNMNFQNLGNFDSAGLKPSSRFIFVVILSIILAIFLQQRIIQICFGSYCLDYSFIILDGEEHVDVMKCIIIGIICGLADALITRLLTETVNKAESKT